MAYGKRKRSMSKTRAVVSKRFSGYRGLGFKRKVLKRRGATRGFSLNTHRFSRYGAAYTLDMTGTEQPLSFEFKLSDMYSYSEFTTLFDKYKLTRAIVSIQMITNPNAVEVVNSSTATNPSNFYPRLWYIADHDDSNTTTIAAIKERVGVRSCVMRPNVIKKISVKPACAVQLYKTATTTGYGPRFGQYIDMMNSDVPHYGLKCVFDPMGLDPLGTFSFRYEWKLYFTCKDVQ